jgi:hypothetical protein
LAAKGEPKAFSCMDVSNGYYYYAFWNGGNKTMVVNVKFSNLNGNKPKKPATGTEFKTEIPPGG